MSETNRYINRDTKSPEIYNESDELATSLTDAVFDDEISTKITDIAFDKEFDNDLDISTEIKNRLAGVNKELSQELIDLIKTEGEQSFLDLADMLINLSDEERKSFQSPKKELEEKLRGGLKLEESQLDHEELAEFILNSDDILKTLSEIAADAKINKDFDISKEITDRIGFYDESIAAKLVESIETDGRDEFVNLADIFTKAFTNKDVEKSGQQTDIVTEVPDLTDRENGKLPDGNLPGAKKDFAPTRGVFGSMLQSITNLAKTVFRNNNSVPEKKTGDSETDDSKVKISNTEITDISKLENQDVTEVLTSAKALLIGNDIEIKDSTPGAIAKPRLAAKISTSVNKYTGR